MPKQRKINDYDSEPVTYCSRCYSLNIMFEDVIGTDCCRDCGCSDVKTASIDDWERLFAERYGHKFVEAKHDVRRSPIFQMSNDELKSKLFKDSSWRDICKSLYPTFPSWLSKADSIILLFAKLCQDNRLDDLRMKLISSNYKNKNYGRAESKDS